MLTSDPISAHCLHYCSKYNIELSMSETDMKLNEMWLAMNGTVSTTGPERIELPVFETDIACANIPQ